MKLSILRIINTILLALIMILLCVICVQMKHVRIEEPVKVISLSYQKWMNAQVGASLAGGELMPALKYLGGSEKDERTALKSMADTYKYAPQPETTLKSGKKIIRYFPTKDSTLDAWEEIFFNYC